MGETLKDKLAGLQECAEKIRGAIRPKSVTPEMVGETLCGIIGAIEKLNDNDCSTVTLRPEFSGEAPEAVREAVEKHVTGQAYALRVKVSDSVTIDPDRPIIPSVPVDSGDTVSKGGDTLSDGGASAVDEDGVSSQADNDGEGRSLSLGITFEVLSTKEVAGTGDGESGIMYELLSVERFRGTVRMYFCTMTVYYNEDLSEVSVSLSPVASEAIYEKQEKLKDSEDITVEGDKLSLTEQAKRALFDEMWVSIGGTKLDNGKYRINNGKELTFAEAMWRYGNDGLIRRWNEAWCPYSNKNRFGGYNETTGLFEGNDQTDITAPQAMKILEVGFIRVDVLNNTNCYPGLFVNVRTLLPIVFSGVLSGVQSITADSIRLVNYYTSNGGASWDKDKYPMAVTNSGSFLYGSSVRHVLGILDVSGDTSYSRHLYNSNLARLETLWLRNIYKGIDLHAAVNFRLECLKYMVENAKETTGQTIVVHNDVYAKLTGDETNEAYTSLTDEEKAQWTALVPMAIEKNIAFATV